MSDHPIHVQLADQHVDPALQVATAPFATWVGTIQVDATGDALLLRSSGDEERLPTHADTAHAVEAAYAADRQPLLAGTGTWLPLIALYPVLTHLEANEAFDVASRMPAPRAEHVALGAEARALVLRAALVEGVAGWAGGVRDSAESPESDA